MFATLLVGLVALGGCLATNATSAADACASAGIFSTASPVYISEILLDSSESDSSGWVELGNSGTNPVTLDTLSIGVLDDGPSAAARLPGNITIHPQSFIIVSLGRHGIAGSVPSTLRVPKARGGSIAVWDDGQLAGRLTYPPLLKDQAFGLTLPPTYNESLIQAASVSNSPGSPSLLQSPTPGAPNSRLRQGPPAIVGTTSGLAALPNSQGNATISAAVLPQGAEIQSVQLIYQQGYSEPQTLLMLPTRCGHFTATLPSHLFTPGALVRWQVAATDSQGRTALDPPDSEGARKHGIIVRDAGETTFLPLLQLSCPDSNAPWSTGPETNAAGRTGGKGGVMGCSMMFSDEFYDNVFVRRRGASSTAWPKPKIKITSNKQGKLFRYPGQTYRIKALYLNSNWMEPGENSYTREPLMWDALGAMGVPALGAFHAVVHFNGAYFGRFSLTEEWSLDALEARGLVSRSAPKPVLWKANSGWMSNLRWDVSRRQIEQYYGLEESPSGTAGAVTELEQLMTGLAGGDSLPRSEYLFQALHLPRVINYMAAQTLVLNQDRCTKNYFMLREAATGQWSVLPWDVESGFGIDRGYGGVPAPDYCILACEQWNSPLYCDRQHVQDVPLAGTEGTWDFYGGPVPPTGGGQPFFSFLFQTPQPQPSQPSQPQSQVQPQSSPLPQSQSPTLQPATVSTTAEAVPAQPDGARAPQPPQFDPGAIFMRWIFGRRRLSSTGRSLKQAPETVAAPEPEESSPSPQTISDAPDPFYNVDQTKNRNAMVYNYSSSFSWLADAVLGHPRTRSMYMRRLRSLMDEFTSGKLEALVHKWNNVSSMEIARDCEKWNCPRDPTLGYQQLIVEQLPIRRAQLYDTYSVGGTHPLIPGPAAAEAQQTVAVEMFMEDLSGSLVLRNPSADAVDLSAHKLVASLDYDFLPGTVIPANDTLIVTLDVVGFLRRHPGKGYFVVGPAQRGTERRAPKIVPK